MMIILIQDLVRFARKCSRLLLAAVVLVGNLFFVRAQEHDMRVFYRFDNASVDAAYLSNPQTLDSIDGRLSAGFSGQVEIVSYSSPEGNFYYNVDLSKRRAESLRRYIVGKYPSLKSRVTINPDGESWDALRADVVSDARISESSRSAMLSIIDSDDAPDSKEASLKAMRDWGYFYSSYFRNLRFASVRFVASAASGDNASAEIEPQGNVPAGSGVRGGFNQGDAVIFGRTKSDISNIFDNAGVLAAISRMLGDQDPDRVNGITIVSASSPEGPESLNKRLSGERGAALRDYIVSKYPALAGKLKVIPAGEAWGDFRDAVVSDTTLTEASRNNILSILVSNSTNDAKEQKLRSLPEWDHILNDIFPGLRYAKMQLDAAPVAEPAVTIDVPVIPDEDITEITEDEPVIVNDTAIVVPVLPVPAVEPAPEAEVVSEPAPAAVCAKPIIAASTNVV